ncbi:MAG: Gfo/Idh/MocA family protein, partial [Vicinamibacteraceae bacterium]
VRSLLKSAEIAKRKNLALVSGFCWRYDPGMREAVAQVRKGAIGDVRALYGTYMRRTLTEKFALPRTPEMSEVEFQIRNWYNFTWLSGEVSLLGSGGHSVDKIAWFMNEEMPIRAVAVGGRQVPTHGNSFDHAIVAYEYANGVRAFLGCRVLDGCHSENADYVIGCDGVLTVGRKPRPEITGRHTWVYDGPQKNKFQVEHDELFASIRSGQPINDGFRHAYTTLMALIGRMAAYTGQEITWEQALNSQESLVPKHIDWDTKLDLPPVAVPGETKFY